MTAAEKIELFRLYIVFIPLLFAAGVYCMIVTHNLIRALIGLEIITKAVTLLIMLAGYLTNRLAIAQTFVITLIVVEVVVIAVIAGIIINIFVRNNSLDTRKLRNLKG